MQQAVNDFNDNPCQPWCGLGTEERLVEIGAAEFNLEHTARYIVPAAGDMQPVDSSSDNFAKLIDQLHQVHLCDVAHIRSLESQIENLQRGATGATGSSENASPSNALSSSDSPLQTGEALPANKTEPTSSETQVPEKGQSRKIDMDLEEIAESTATQLGIEPADVMKAWKAFSRIDVDGSGKVSTTELHKLLEEVTGQKLSDAAVEGVLRKFDKDADGELDFEEFLFCYSYTPAKRVSHLRAALYTKSDALDERFRTRMVGVAAKDLKKYLQKELDEEQAFLQIPMIFLLFVFFLMAASMHRQTAVMNSVESGVKFDIEENANFAFVGAAPFENGRMGHKGLHDVNSFADFWSWLDLGLGPLFFPSGWGTSEARSNVAARCTSPIDAMDGLAMLRNSAQSKTSNTPYGAQANGSYAAITGDLGTNLCNMDAGTEFPKSLERLDVYTKGKAPYLGFNEILAGVRLRQEQLPEVECPNAVYHRHAYTGPCIQVNDGAWLAPDLDMVLPMNEDLIDKPGGKTAYFRSGIDLQELHRQIRLLEDARWLNQRTGKVEVTFATYNNHVDMFVGVYIDFFITRGGHIHKIIKPYSFSMQPYGNPWSYVVDGVFALLVMKLFLTEAWQIISSVRGQGWRAGFGEYFSDFKNIVDWTSIGWSVVVFVMWAKWCIMVSDLGDLLQTADTTQIGGWKSDAAAGDIFTPNNAAFWESIDDIAEYEESLQVALSFYPLLLGLRFFSAFSSQPRLAIVTKTLSAAASDLMNFGVVMFTTLLTFAASAVMLFGREVEEFENFGRAFVAVFRGTLGDLDYDELTETGRATSNVWWSVFVILANCVMLNMVLAIVMDSYSSVKEAMGEDIEDYPTIGSQSYEIYRRWIGKRKGTRVSLTYLIKCLGDHEDEEFVTKEKAEGRVVQSKLITVSTFMKLAAGLNHKQAERLLGAARNYFERQDAAAVDIKDVLVRIRGVDLRLQQVSAMTESIGEFDGLVKEKDKEVLLGASPDTAYWHAREQHIVPNYGAGHEMHHTEVPI